MDIFAIIENNCLDHGRRFLSVHEPQKWHQLMLEEELNLTQRKFDSKDGRSKSCWVLWKKIPRSHPTLSRRDSLASKVWELLPRFRGEVHTLGHIMFEGMIMDLTQFEQACVGASTACLRSCDLRWQWAEWWSTQMSWSESSRWFSYGWRSKAAYSSNAETQSPSFDGTQSSEEELIQVHLP